MPTPKTASDAFKLGLSHGSDSTGMLAHHCAWPSDDAMEAGGPLIEAYTSGWSEGNYEMILESRHRDNCNLI